MDFPGAVLRVLPTSLYLVAWIVAAILAVMMVRRGGGRPERFLLVGTSLMLLSSLFTALARVLQPWLVHWLVQIENTPGPASLPPLFLGIEILRGCIFAAGIICLVYAFWIKFKARPTPRPTSKEPT